MLDIRFIRDHMDQVQESSKWKKCDVDLDRILQLDDERCLIIQQADTLKEERTKRLRMYPDQVDGWPRGTCRVF